VEVPTKFSQPKNQISDFNTYAKFAWMRAGPIRLFSDAEKNTLTPSFNFSSTLKKSTLYRLFGAESKGNAYRQGDGIKRVTQRTKTPRIMTGGFAGAVR
jgi:hypothetical protein